MQGNGFLFELQIGHPVAHLGGEFIELALDPGGIDVLHLHLAGHALVQPRRRKHDMGPDFADVFLSGVRLFGEIQGVAHLKAAGDGHHLLADPGKGKIGDKIVRVVAGVHGHEVPAHGQHVPVAQQRAFGQGGGTRGVEQQADVVAVALVDQIFEEIRFPGIQFLPQFLDLLQADEERPAW